MMLVKLKLASADKIIGRMIMTDKVPFQTIKNVKL